MWRISSYCHLLVIFCQLLTTCSAIDRVFYIACAEEDWDYAPGGTDEVNVLRYGKESSAPVFLDNGTDRIGHIYRKAIYREYTDDTYSVEIPKPDWLGFLGPVMRAEQGDTIVIHFKNMATQIFSMHPHGVSYLKISEGAFYGDGFHNNKSSNDLVAPGNNHTYRWEVTDEASPSAGDPDCLTWLYHSHVEPVEDIYSGLIGFLLTCRKDRLEDWQKIRQYATYVSVMDENLSWYIDYNIATFTAGTVDKDDEDFKESNLMHAINGYVYGHLPGLEACSGETIHWHMGTLGTEIDLHAIAISGHSFEYLNQREDSIRVTVAHFATSVMKALHPGKWLMSCQVHDHFTAGMEAFFTVKKCPGVSGTATDDEYSDESYESGGSSDGSSEHGCITRKYYIAAEEVMWDYAPSGKNKYDGGNLLENGSNSQVFFQKDANHIGGVYKKALFIEYRNRRFTRKTVRSAEEVHLGFLGPVIRGEVGDVIKVVFYNRACRPYSIHPHGVEVSKDNEGADYKDGFNPNIVKPGRKYTYTWTIPEVMGPAAEDPACLTRMYTSDVDYVKDVYSGLVGPMLICKKGALKRHGGQIGVDKEFFLMTSVTDENKSWYLNDNKLSLTAGSDFEESNLMHGINGRLYGNLDGLDMCIGDKVSWHVFSVGSEVDFHTLAFHGDTFFVGQNQRASTDVLVGDMRTLMMTPSHIGSWGIICETYDHRKAGTTAIYNVHGSSGEVADSGEQANTGRTVTVFLQATEVDWNYIPTNRDNVRSVDVNQPGSFIKIFAGDGPGRIGGTYRKIIYKEFQDASFSTPVVRGADEDYLGLLGPIIRVEVGDELVIVFKNAASAQKHSIRLQGVFYQTNGVFSPQTQPSVAPGNTFTYKWNITESAGPGTTDPECLTSIYFSDVNLSKDTNSGLIGTLAICRKGALAMTGGKLRRVHVDKEFAAYFSVMDENDSWYLQHNIDTYVSGATTVDTDDEDFKESNLMHAINGYIFGNQPIPTMDEGNIVDWYLTDMGTEVDMHAVHYHGNDIILTKTSEHSNDVAQLFPGIAITARMLAVNPGFWLYHCHVDDHINAGMQSFYEIKPRVPQGGGG